MLYVIIVLSIALLIMTIKYILYRRQVKNICRQLCLLEKEVTNYRVRTDISEKEVKELAEHINYICDSHNQKEILLVKKDKHLKETLTNVSHDIRTPLTSLKGYFQLLMSEEDAEQKLKYADVMSERMNNLSDLLDELFTYTKLQNEDYKLELGEYDMTKLVLDTIFSFYDMFKKKVYEPELDIDEKSYIVLCNDIAVKRIISNIIKNAVVHGTDTIKLSYKALDGWVCFACENRVEHPENIEVKQIFNRFYKADKARSEKSTGLGLAIAKEMVDKMGGSISADLQDDIFKIEVRFKQ